MLWTVVAHGSPLPGQGVGEERKAVLKRGLVRKGEGIQERFDDRSRACVQPMPPRFRHTGGLKRHRVKSIREVIEGFGVDSDSKAAFSYVESVATPLWLRHDCRVGLSTHSARFDPVSARTTLRASGK